MSFLDDYFKITERDSTISREVMGGVTTFLAMAYIIIVNPSILSLSGMDKGALITVTCLASFIGTIIAGVWANSPIALAPGMGLNAFFTYTLTLEKQVPWQTALGIVFLSGCFFLILAIGGIRERIANSIPVPLRLAVGGGIGLFIAFIGLKSMGIVVANQATYVGLGEFTKTTCVSIIGLFIIAIMEIKRMKGGILLGIIVTTILGIIIGDVSLPEKVISLPPSPAPIMFKLDILSAMKLSLIGPIFSFMFVDLFDSLGTLMSCSKEMGLVNEKGEIKNLGRMLYTDAASTIMGASLGTSTVTAYVESAAGIVAGARTGLAATVTAYVESAAGIVAGARTGLAATVTALGFLLSLFFTPLISIVPGYATAPALIVVGIFMFRQVAALDFSDFKILFPAFITIFTMPLTYSISTGLALGFLSYLIVHILVGDFKKINITLGFIGAICLLHLLV